jgi:hypothetical protein
MKTATYALKQPQPIMSDAEVVRNRIRMTTDFSGSFYDGDRPNLNWNQFIAHLKNSNHLHNRPKLAKTILPAKRY